MPYWLQAICVSGACLCFYLAGAVYLGTLFYQDQTEAERRRSDDEQTEALRTQ